MEYVWHQEWQCHWALTSILVNTHHRNDPSSPWGGIKSSGIGSENGIGQCAPFVDLLKQIC
jgi:acyl-CoA reductase-like NAD-dependent aldehyde dehydrogenase